MWLRLSIISPLIQLGKELGDPSSIFATVGIGSPADSLMIDRLQQLIDV